MMDLLGFLENWDLNTQINVETNKEKVYSGRIADLGDETASKYWVVEGAVTCKPDSILILVEHEDEVNKKLEEENSVSFSAIWKAVQKDSQKTDQTKQAFISVVKAANNYVYYRKNWNRFPAELLGHLDKERSIEHDIFISELIGLADLLAESGKNLIAWRKALGEDRHMLGEFAAYIVDAIDRSKVRIEIIEAIQWAQEHQNQIMFLLDEAVDNQDARMKLMVQYSFSYDQAQAITDMRLRAFEQEEKKKLNDELECLLEQVKMYPEI